MKHSLNNEEIGERIRCERKKRHMTREQLSEGADISTQFIADIETGKKSMTISTLSGICDALGISADFVIFGKPDGTAEQLARLTGTLDAPQRETAIELLRVFASTFDVKPK